MKHTVILAGLFAALATSFAVAAAEDMHQGMDMSQDQAMPAEKPVKLEQSVKPRVKPHNHYEANKQGIAPGAVEPVSTPAKPLHDHLKVHKQG